MCQDVKALELFIVAGFEDTVRLVNAGYIYQRDTTEIRRAALRVDLFTAVIPPT